MPSILSGNLGIYQPDAQVNVTEYYAMTTLNKEHIDVDRYTRPTLILYFHFCLCDMVATMTACGYLYLERTHHSRRGIPPVKN